MEMDMQLLQDQLQLEHPEKMIVNIDDYESEDHQTYKYLFEALNEKYQEMLQELHMLITDKQQLEQELAENEELVKQLQKENQTLKSTGTSVLADLEDYINKPIYVLDVKAGADDAVETTEMATASLEKTISSSPGIYGEKRPSWYTPLQYELSLENVRKKNVASTVGTLKGKLLFWKKSEPGLQIMQLATAYDEDRKQKIIELLHEDCSNEEKYIKYMLLTPGIDSEYQKTLDGAADKNINANLIIALLEQPKEMYNREIIEMYISQIHKGTEYDLKQELAKELVAGRWYITASINNTEQKLQLVPQEELEAIRKQIELLKNGSCNDVNEEVCANLAQTSSDDFENGESIDLYASDQELSSLLEFNDDMLIGE